MDEWFDIYSLTDPSAREELQMEGLRESVGFLLKTIHDEIELLNGDASRLFIMGISQGYATGLIAMLAGQVKLGGLIGLSGCRAPDGPPPNSGLLVQTGPMDHWSRPV